MLSDDWLSLDATLIVELVAFGAVLAVVARFVIRPLQDAMARRRAEIQTSLDKARQAEELLAAAEAEYEQKLRAARQEARFIIETARAVAADIGRPDRASGNRAPDRADSAVGGRQ